MVSEDLIPRGREMQTKGQNVLVKFGIDAYDGNGKKVDPTKINWDKVTPGTYSYSQQPGKENPLGFPENQLRQRPFGLHARHAVGPDFRAQLPLRKFGLHPRSQHRKSGDMAAR